jgi:transcription elongation GreA/GreB family factor
VNFTRSRPTLTPAGRRRLEKELERLRERLNEATERLRQELRDTDDLNWYSTQEELALMRSRIAELQEALVAEPDGTFSSEEGAVALGSTVAVEDEAGREHSLFIVTSIEADAARGCISVDSPVGAALLGRRPGESVSFSVPRGQRQFRVLRVEAFSGGGV